MIWEAAPLAQSKEQLAELGVSSLVYDPAATRPESGDWLTVMRGNIENLRRAAPSPRSEGGDS